MMKTMEEPDYSAMRELIELRHGQCLVVVTILFFQVVSWKLKSRGPPKTLSEDEWSWRNIYCSWVHAIITSLWMLVCIFLHPEMFTSVASLMLHITKITYFCVCFSTGYFLSDFLDMMINNKLLVRWDVVIHHVVVLGIFLYNVYFKMYIAYSIVALFVEFNSVFLHWRKLLRMVKEPYDSRQYLIVKYLNLVTFFVCRGFVMIVITGSCYFLRNDITFAYCVGLSFTMFLFDILMTVLFWRLLKSDLFKGTKGSRSSVCSNLKRDWSIIFGHKSSSNGGEDNMSNNNVNDVLGTHKKVS